MSSPPTSSDNQEPTVPPDDPLTELFQRYLQAKQACHLNKILLLRTANRINMLRARIRLATTKAGVASHKATKADSEAQQRMQHFSAQTGQDLLQMQLQQQLLQQYTSSAEQLSQQSNSLLLGCRQQFAEQLQQLIQKAQPWGLTSVSWDQTTQGSSKFYWRSHLDRRSMLQEAANPIEPNVQQPIIQWIQQHRQHWLELAFELKDQYTIRLTLQEQGLSCGPALLVIDFSD